MNMKKLVCIIGIVGLLCACSKSLTDYGYKGGPTTTENPNESIPNGGISANNGANSVEYPIVLGSGWPSEYIRAYENVNFRKIGVRKEYLFCYSDFYSNKNMNISEKKSNFLCDFYFALFGKEKDRAKMAQRYKRYCATTVLEAVQSNSRNDSSNNGDDGWQIFGEKPKNQGKRETNVFFSGMDSDWVNVKICSIDTTNIQIRLEQQKKRLMITGIKNTMKHISLE